MSKSTSFYIYVFFPAERQGGETAALYQTGIEVKISFEQLEGYSISFKHMAYGE